MHSRSTAAWALLGGAVLLPTLTGCDTSRPTVVETPTIVWESGAPDQEDPFAAAVREYLIGYSIAFNARDFTVDQLTATTTSARIEGIYESFRSQYVSAGAAPRVYAGPLPYSVLEVIPDGDDAASVIVCYPISEWWMEADHPEPEIDAAAGGQLATYTVGLDEGVLKVVEVKATVDPCEVADVVVGLFDPAPEPPDSISERDIRPPLTLTP